ncbi:MAG: OsmC family protein [Rhodospirillaceae bacterium]|nr:OsmC family protein [Rhodospirillaceae bacterium]
MSADGHAHSYTTTLTWTGNTGSGTSDYRAYSRDHVLTGPGKPEILASADTPFRGDATRWNPEDMLVASLSACHLLWYLHMCARAGIVVSAYTDNASGTMVMDPTGRGQFTEVTLRPQVTITDAARIADATALHAKAHELCFIARSVNFPVGHEPTVTADTAVA